MTKPTPKVYILPQSAVRFVQELIDTDFVAGRHFLNEPTWFSANSYRGNGGKLYEVNQIIGTGRATCSGCGLKIAKGEPCLKLNWKDSESYGYFLMKKPIHKDCKK